MKIQIAANNCSNIKLPEHAAQFDFGVLMTNTLLKTRSRTTHNYSSWFMRFEQISNQDFTKGNVLPLDLAFESISLRTICENEGEAIHKFGKPVAETLIHRLADIRAAFSIKDLLVGHPRVIEDGASNQNMVINLKDDFQLLFSANHPTNPLTQHGTIDWEKVSRVKILRIARNNV